MAEATLFKLFREARKAIPFSHRCLLYAHQNRRAPFYQKWLEKWHGSLDTQLDPPGAFHSSQPLYEYADFLNDVESEKDGLNNPDPYIAKATVQALCISFSDQINRAYSDGINSLYDRHKGVYIRYRIRKLISRYLLVWVSDRNAKSTFSSAKHIYDKNKELLRSINTTLKSLMGGNNPSKNYSEEWEVVRESAKGFMEEINFLNRRVDDFNGYINSRIGTGLTVTSILIGIITFLISQSGKGDDSRKRSAALYMELGKLSEKTSSLSRATEAQQMREDAGEISSKLDSLKQALDPPLQNQK